MMKPVLKAYSRHAISALLISLVISGCMSWPSADETQKHAETMVSQAFPGMPAELVKRGQQDRQQAICSGAGPVSQDGAAEVARLSREGIRPPANGKFAGDWKAGEKLAYNGTGQRIRDGRVEKLPENGGLCSNCHVLDPKEVNAGNLGPSLAGYGTQRGNSDAIVRYTYEKIYDGWAVVPCSKMPRMGHNGFLSPEQIAHLVAYLVDPASPVNSR